MWSSTFNRISMLKLGVYLLLSGPSLKTVAATPIKAEPLTLAKHPVLTPDQPTTVALVQPIVAPLIQAKAFSLMKARGLTSVKASEPVCYFPDGQPAVDFSYRPSVDPKKGFSTCCDFSEGDVLIPGLNLCWFPPGEPGSGYGGYLYRAACSDKSWNDPAACSQICVTNAPNRFETVGYCKDTDDFCCPKSVKNGGDCCNDPTLRFRLDVPQNVSKVLKSQLSSTYTGPVNSPGTSPGLNSGTKAWQKGQLAGLGVGVGFGSLLLGALIYWCIRRHGFKTTIAGLKRWKNSLIGIWRSRKTEEYGMKNRTSQSTNTSSGDENLPQVNLDRIPTVEENPLPLRGGNDYAPHFPAEMSGDAIPRTLNQPRRMSI